MSSVQRARYKREKKLFILSLFMKLMSSIAEHRDSWLCSQVGTGKFVLLCNVIALFISTYMYVSVTEGFFIIVICFLWSYFTCGEGKEGEEKAML